VKKWCSILRKKEEGQFAIVLDTANSVLSLREFRLVSSCLEKTEDVTAKCASECQVATEVPLRLDSSPAASVNPTVFLDGAASSCKKHVCMLKCSQKNFNQACAGAGDLFKVGGIYDSCDKRTK
ncbi:hypothetical protein OESDEN_07710, partial [Oesophagostomum dentatum]